LTKRNGPSTRRVPVGPSWVGLAATTEIPDMFTTSDDMEPHVTRRGVEHLMCFVAFKPPEIVPVLKETFVIPTGLSGL
jgi:hypothetical protein